MRQRQQQQQQNNNTNGGQTAETGIRAIIYSLAFTLEAWLHTGFGIRFIGVKGLTGCLILLGFSQLYPSDNHQPLWVFTAFYTALWILAQLGAWYRRLRKRVDGHTRYSGRPHLSRLLPWCRQDTIKRLEPIFVMAAGYGIHHLNRPLGTYLLTAGSALLFTAAFRIAAERERVLDMNDAVASQQVTAESFRELDH